MSDETLDGGNVNEGTPSQPSAGGSQGQSDSNGSSAGQSQSLEAVLSRLDELDKRTRALQGEKDRGVAQNKKAVDEMKAKIAEIEKLTKRGMTQDEAIEALSERDELLEAARLLRSQQVSAQPKPVGNGGGEAVEKAKVLAQYGLSENDPEVALALNSEKDVEKVALRVAFKRSQKQPDPAASSAATSKPVTTMREDEAANKLNSLTALYREPSKNASAIKQVQDELKAAGYL